MPTGLTAALYEGKREVTFEEYALGVARHFGACITMRDDPSDAKIPDKFEASSYHTDEIKKARVKLVEIGVWDAARWQDEADRDYKEKCKQHEERLAEKLARKARYEAMLEKARQFKAPTPDHKEYAKMLVDQLEQSIDWDCSASYMDKPTKQTKWEFKADTIKQLTKNIEYHESSHREEVERAEKRTAWVQALRDAIAEFQTANA